MKAWWKSWTINFNLLAAIFLALESVDFTSMIQSDAVRGWVGLVIVVVNILLRFKTTKAVGIKDA